MEKALLRTKGFYVTKQYDHNGFTSLFKTKFLNKPLAWLPCKISSIYLKELRQWVFSYIQPKLTHLKPTLKLTWSIFYDRKEIPVFS